MIGSSQEGQRGMEFLVVDGYIPLTVPESTEYRELEVDFPSPHVIPPESDNAGTLTRISNFPKSGLDTTWDSEGELRRGLCLPILDSAILIEKASGGDVKSLLLHSIHQGYYQPREDTVANKVCSMSVMVSLIRSIGLWSRFVIGWCSCDRSIYK